MVTLNLTLFIQLGLFLVFLWVTHTFFLRRVLRVMDSRDEQMEKDQVDAQADAEQAQADETRYAREMGSVRRQAHVAMEQARREAMDEHTAALRERRKEADQEVAAVRAEARALVEAEREKYSALTPGIAEAMARRLGVRGEQS